jgi:hypothetical protein
MRGKRVVVGIAFLASACSRAGVGGADAAVEAGLDAGTAAVTATGERESVEAGGRVKVARREAVGAMEARRSSVGRIESEPVLAGQAELLRKQFGGVLPASFGLQATELTPAGRRGVLVGAERKDGTLESPLVFVVDARNAVLWSKERPVAGIKPPVGPAAIADGPEGRFAIAVCDPPTSSVALRLWDGDGSPFADFQALETKACDAITLLYWPTHGWLIVAAGASESRAQLVTDNGGLAWAGGRVLGARWRTVAPASVASDTATSFVLVQYSQSPGVDRDADHAVAFRYDANAQPLWPSPTDLGAVRRIEPGKERVVLTRTTDGTLRATLPTGLVELRSNGETRRVP